MQAGTIWVCGLDRVTGERSILTSCSRANALFCAAGYELDGYDVKLLEDWEIDQALGAGRASFSCC